MNIRIITLLILSGVCVQAHAMDGGLAAEDMETGRWSRFTNYVSSSTVVQWFTQAQHDDEDIKGGIPGIRYLMHHHGGKCIIAGTAVVGGYLVYRHYKNKKKEQNKVDEQTDQPVTQFPKKELKNTVATILAYVSAQISNVSHLIK